MSHSMNKLIAVALGMTTTALALPEDCNNAAALATFVMPPVSSASILIDRMTTAHNRAAPPPTDEETPVFLRYLWGIQTIMWYSLAAYDGVTKDLFTHERPQVTANFVLSGSELEDVAMLANWYGIATYLALSRDARFTNGANAYMASQQIAREDPTLPYTEFAPDFLPCVAIQDKSTRTECMDQVAEAHCYSPQYIGYIIGTTLYETIDTNDYLGYNPAGAIGADGEACTANCEPFSDTLGYYPVNDAYRLKFKSKSTADGHWDIKFKKDSDRWAPLRETNHLGYFTRQEHVTPQIGFGHLVAMPQQWLEAGDKCNVRKRFGACAKVNDPEYDYGLEAQRVIERVNSLSTDTLRKAKTEVMDLKGEVTKIFSLALKSQAGVTNRHRMEFSAGMLSAVVDALIVAWREKVLFDLIRPTTVIQAMGDEEIEAWAGPYQEVRTIKARDFQPYLRVMPHSEFPSGSACICTAIVEFAYAYIGNELGLDDMELEWVQFAGWNHAEPGFPEEDVVMHWSTMASLAHECGQSRLWGGMHFTQSVSTAEQLCTGIGSRVYQTLHQLKL